MRLLRIEKFNLSICMLLLFLLPHNVFSQDFSENEESLTISRALELSTEEERLYNEHVTVLSSRWMAGRLPGSPGMERAKSYMETWFEIAGLEGGINDSNNLSSFRQKFKLGEEVEIKSSSFGYGTDNKNIKYLEEGKDFVGTKLGVSGTYSGNGIFVGYGIESGPDNFSSYGENFDFAGSAAVMFRFEPMDE